MSKAGRNDPCPCGSGKKYKKCCLALDEQRHLERSQQDDMDALFEEDRLDVDARFADADGIENFDDAPDIVLEPYASKTIDKQLPKISDEQEALIDAWWSEYKDMQDPDRILAHLQPFLQTHPELVEPLGLHEEILFDVGDKLIKLGRAGEYIALLKQVRETFPSTYLKSFGFLDRDIIAYSLIEQGCGADIAPYLDWFREYPDADPDNLFGVINLLMVGECDARLMALLEATYDPLIRSTKVFGGDDALNILIYGYCTDCLDAGGSRSDLDRLLERLKALTIPLLERWYDPERVETTLSQISGDLDAGFLDTFRITPDMPGYYDTVTLNFMGWLHREQGFSWMKAQFYRKQVLLYLLMCIPNGKRPRQPFTFTRQLLDRTLADNARFIIGLDGVKALGSINAMHWFADYLVQRGFIADALGDDLRRWCRELWESSIDPLRKDSLGAGLFQDLPN
jgi:hypothetical protein